MRRPTSSSPATPAMSPTATLPCRQALPQCPSRHQTGDLSRTGGMRKDLGLLLIRVGVGATVAAHGTQKLFGWFGGGGLEGTSKMFEMGGFRPARQHAMAAGLSETGSGALLALGLATPAAGAALAGTMAVAGELHK